MPKKIQKIILVVLVVYAVLGFFIFPFILKKQIVTLVEEQTNAKIRIEKITFNPFSFKLNVNGVELKNLDNSNLFTLQALSLNIEVHSLLKSAIHVKNLMLKNPEIWVVLNKDKSLNLISIVKQTQEEEKSGNTAETQIPRIILDRIAIQNGSLYYEDYTKENKFDFSLSELEFVLKNIDTHDFKTSKGELKFHSSLSDGGVISLHNRVLGFNPLVLQGKINIISNKLYTGWKYMQDSLNLEVADGEFSFNTDYYINLNDLNSTTLSNLNTTIHKLRIKPKKTSNDILTLNSFTLKDANIEPFHRKVKINEIALDSFYITAQENKKGVIDWEEYIKNPNQKAENSEDANTTSGAWKVAVNTILLEKIEAHFSTKKNDKTAFSQPNNFNLELPSLLLKNLSINTKEELSQTLRLTLEEVALKSASFTLNDEAFSPATKTKIDKINVNLHGIDTKKESPFHYDFSLRANESGYATSKGSLCLSPMEQNGTIFLDKISLKELTPYIQKSAFAKINSGFLSLQADTNYAKSPKKADLNVVGSLNLEDFSLGDSRSKRKKNLLSFKNVALKSFDYEMSPDKLFVNQIDIDSLYLHAIIYKNKSMNLSSIMKDQKKAKTKTSDAFPMKINKIKVSNGSAYFTDLSLPIKFKTNIHSINGAIYPLTTANNIKSHVDVRGKVDKYGSTKLQGTINSFNPKKYTHLNLDFKNLDLKSASGYSASFAGYKIDNGKLFLDLTYDIKESKLVSKNNIVIKKIELGESFKDENTSSLPLGFVIALLEDKDGVIDINMPIEGDVDAPDFKYGALVWKTLGNLILKAVASPFNFLASMMGIGGDELDYSVFAAGSSEITPSEEEKLDKIAELIEKRPKIALNIAGGYDAQTDKEAIQKAKLLALAIQKSDAKTDEEKANALNIDFLEDIYEDTKDDDKIDEIKDALEKKFENDNEFEVAYLDALINECITLMSVTQEEMIALANQRSAAIKKYLIEIKNINPLKVNEIEPKETRDNENNLVKTKLEVTTE